MTVNLRKLIHMSGLRLCTMAHGRSPPAFDEIRHEIFAVSPFFGKLLVPKCVPLGYSTRWATATSTAASPHQHGHGGVGEPIAEVRWRDRWTRRAESSPFPSGTRRVPLPLPQRRPTGGKQADRRGSGPAGASTGSDGLPSRAMPTHSGHRPGDRPFQSRVFVERRTPQRYTIRRPRRVRAGPRDATSSSSSPCSSPPARCSSCCPSRAPPASHPPHRCPLHSDARLP